MQVNIKQLKRISRTSRTYCHIVSTHTTRNGKSGTVRFNATKYETTRVQKMSPFSLLLAGNLIGTFAVERDYGMNLEFLMGPCGNEIPKINLERLSIIYYSYVISGELGIDFQFMSFKRFLYGRFNFPREMCRTKFA